MEGLLTRLALLGLICGVIGGIRGGSLSLREESGEWKEKENEVMKKKHDRFFKSLPLTERTWILRLVLKLEAEKVKGIGGVEVEGRDAEKVEMEMERRGGGGGGGCVKPVDEFSLIPPQLFDVMLNGDVSEKFQKDLIKWLRKDYGIEDEEFAKFNTQTEQICHNGKCWDLGDIGSECCPF